MKQVMSSFGQKKTILNKEASKFHSEEFVGKKLKSKTIGFELNFSQFNFNITD